MFRFVSPLSGSDHRIYFHSPFPRGTLQPGDCPVRGKHGHLYADVGPRTYTATGVAVEQKPCPCGRKIGDP